MSIHINAIRQCALWLFFAGAMVVNPGSQAREQDNPLEQAIAAYQAGAYRMATELLEQATVDNQDVTADHYLWLGRSYGRLAEQANFLSALSLARETRRNLERAVELDAGNVEALEDLLAFYEQAPAFIGGGQDKAEKVRDQLTTLKKSPRAAYN